MCLRSSKRLVLSAAARKGGRNYDPAADHRRRPSSHRHLLFRFTTKDDRLKFPVKSINQISMIDIPFHVRLINSRLVPSASPRFFLRRLCFSSTKSWRRKALKLTKSLTSRLMTSCWSGVCLAGAKVKTCAIDVLVQSCARQALCDGI